MLCTWSLVFKDGVLLFSRMKRIYRRIQVFRCTEASPCRSPAWWEEKTEKRRKFWFTSRNKWSAHPNLWLTHDFEKETNVFFYFLWSEFDHTFWKLNKGFLWICIQPYSNTDKENCKNEQTHKQTFATSSEIGFELLLTLCTSAMLRRSLCLDTAGAGLEWSLFTFQLQKKFMTGSITISIETGV